MPSSIVVDVRRAVVAGLEGLLSPDVQVTYGYAGSDTSAQRRQVFTGRARATHDPAALKTGRNFRNERMEFDIVVLVKGVGLRPEDCDDQAIEIGTVVEEFVADHKSNELEVDGLNWLRMQGMEMNNAYGSGGSGTITEITYTVVYDARLE